MRTTITPVDEADTEFLIHPPKPLFPEVQAPFGGGAIIPPDTMLFNVTMESMTFNNTGGFMEYNT